jgi:chromosomal replication initiator protein
MAIDGIIQIVADYFGVTLEDIRGRGRTQSLSVPRKIACYAVKHMLPMSYEDIGTWLGLRDHSTISYYCTDVKQKARTDAMIQMHLNAINRRLEDAFTTHPDDGEQ